MTLQSGKETIAIHIWPNTSRIKDSQTTQFGQLIEYKSKAQIKHKTGGGGGGEYFRPFSKN